MEIFFAHNATIKNPHPTGTAVFTLHGLEHLLKGRHFSPVARKDFVGERKTFRGDNQRDNDLLAVRPVIARVAALAALDISYTFLGAAVLPLLVDDPALVEIRPTKDVDVGVEIVTLPEHYVLEERLRTAGFRHDTREGAPICRWIVEEDVTADIMPTEAGVLGLESKWFREALQNATEGTWAAASRLP